jgi:hypothetical protein
MAISLVSIVAIGCIEGRPKAEGAVYEGLCKRGTYWWQANIPHMVGDCELRGEDAVQQELGV